MVSTKQTGGSLRALHWEDLVDHAFVTHVTNTVQHEMRGFLIFR